MTPTAPIGVIGHYNLLERLEPSGPGDLYRARDTRLGRTVVIRVLPSEFAADAASRVALIEPARATKVLSHPNATALFDIGEHDGRVYLVFEFLNGRSLRAEMAGRPMRVRRAVEIAIQVADAVAEAHAAGFAHGGLSPESITITTRGHAKIPAFDLAVRSGFAAAPASGGRSRLIDYESPEEARGDAPDDRSDVYSVGAILYEMLTARRPSHRGAAAPSASNPHVPPELDQIVLKAAAPNPDSRYQAVAALASELRSLNAMLDARGSSDDEDVSDAAAPNTLGRVVALTFLILLAAALLAWWVMRG